MSRRLLFWIAFLAALPALAGIRGEASASGESVRLTLRPDASVAGARASLFIAIVAVKDGQPDPALAGWYDGKTWVAGGLPRAAFTGVLPATDATVRVPGGVCAQVKAAGGPAGTYGLYAGWGRVPVDTAGLDDGQLQRMIATAPPDIAAQLRQLAADRAAAQGRMAQYSQSDSAAFTNMRSSGTFWQIKTFECGD